MNTYQAIWTETGSVQKTISGIIKHLRETEDVRVVNAVISMDTKGDHHACSALVKFTLVGKYEPKEIVVEVNTHFKQVSIDPDLNYGNRVMDTVSFTIARITEDDFERIWMYTADEFDDNAHMWNQHVKESETIADYLHQYDYWRKQDAIFNPKHP
jgi:hypothetical protein